ncbi:hypothetical protein AcV5_008293 [Taiwanofungus camphoratus]|nr:hypothetical protein AcV5_008293 [Antrodia cinnamomea]KAI0955688.1 hypothetical protein AcV7_006286 [Antrodia cinnamomea]
MADNGEFYVPFTLDGKLHISMHDINATFPAGHPTNRCIHPPPLPQTEIQPPPQPLPWGEVPQNPPPSAVMPALGPPQSPRGRRNNAGGSPPGLFRPCRVLPVNCFKACRASDAARHVPEKPAVPPAPPKFAPINPGPINPGPIMPMAPDNNGRNAMNNYQIWKPPKHDQDSPADATFCKYYGDLGPIAALEIEESWVEEEVREGRPVKISHSIKNKVYLDKKYLSMGPYEAVE